MHLIKDVLHNNFSETAHKSCYSFCTTELTGATASLLMGVLPENIHTLINQRALWANSFMLFAMKWFKCLLSITVFINVGGTSISVKLLPDMCLSYQQAYNWLDDWGMNHVLYNRFGQYSIVLCVVVKHLCSLFSKCCVVYKKWKLCIHCLLVTAYVWYFTQRKCEWSSATFVSKRWESLQNFYTCVLLQKIQDKIKDEYSISYALHWAYFVILVECTVGRLSGCR